MLAGATFVSVTSEILPTGLLPDMARELHVSESRIGLLVTIFAGTVVVSTTPLAALTRRHSRKALIVVVLIVNATAAVLAAIAPSYGVLVGARVLGGLAHGLFWAVVGAYTAHLVPKELIGRAVAITSAGPTAAFVLGVPLGTALGHLVGWRLAFAAVGGVILVLALLVVVLLPSVDHHVPLSTGEIALPARKDRSLPAVIVVCLVVIVVMGGQNVFYTYVAPWLIAVGGVDESSIAPMLFLYGGAGAIGLVLVGFVPDRHLRRSFVVAVGIVLVAVLALGLLPPVPLVVIVAMVVWGAALGGLPAMLQTRMLHTASARVRDVSAALFTSSFNVGIGGGALVGGILLDRFGVGVLPFAEAIVLVVAVALSLVTDAWLAARAHRARPTTA